MNSVSTAELVSQLTNRLHVVKKYDGFISDFARCSTNAQRVACLYNLPEVQDIIQIKENYKPKSKKDAELLRAEGNAFFKSGNYPAARDKYTESILKAPDDSENLALAYSNRSTVNFYLKKYKICLQDIEMAFLHNYPKSTCYKLYQRLGRCMYYLRHKGEAVKAFQQTIVVLEHTPDISAENKQEMIVDMTKAIAKCATITGASENVSCFNYCHQGIPDLSYDPSTEVPCLANSVEIRLDNYGGRGLFAKSNIEIGEVLITENPYSSVLLKEFNLTHCQNCCNRVALPLPCKQCSGVVFCSLACRESAWAKFHWAECKILESIQRARGDLGLLATRIILTTGYPALVKMTETDAIEEVERQAGFNKDGIFSSEDYSAVYSLVNHVDKRTVKDLLSRTMSALFFLKHLEFVKFFCDATNCANNETFHRGDDIDCNSNASSSLKEDEILMHKHCVGGHILRNIMMLPCNAHEVSEFSLNVTSPAMSITTELAAAIYPVLSLVNHSCDPSIVRHSFGNLCVARAIRSIKAGEELKDNYGALYPTMDRDKRHSGLISQYFFSCTCEACVNDWPQYFEIPCERPVFRCLVCNDRVPIPLNNLTETAVCLSCGHTQDITPTLLHMGEMEGAYKEALTSVIDGNDTPENINILLTYLRFVERHVQRPWRDINDCQEAFKQCLNIRANCYPCQ